MWAGKIAKDNTIYHYQTSSGRGQAIDQISHHFGRLRGVEKVGAARCATKWIRTSRASNRIKADPVVGVEVFWQFPTEKTVNHVFDLFFGHPQILSGP